VSGKVAPEIEKPAPAMLAELIVTAWAPFDVSVTTCVLGVLRTTFPKVTLLELTASEGLAV
jgi:hypothetical protein